jgi:mono/diheme cytochrome c family protein
VTTLTSPVTGNAVTGKKLYYDHACYSCHGFNGETGARAFVPNWPANLATERSFIAFLRGRANVAPVQPSTSMPNYPVESVSDAQAKDIYAYIRSFKSAQPQIEKIPVMNQILAAAKKPYNRKQIAAQGGAVHGLLRTHGPARQASWRTKHHVRSPKPRA